MKKLINFIALYIVSAIRFEKIYLMDVTTDDYNETSYEWYLRFYWIEKEYSSWSKSIQNRGRGKVFKIPKILNRSIRFIFGKRKYSAQYQIDKDYIMWTEPTTKKLAMEHINFIEAEFLCWNLDYIEYEGFLFGGHTTKFQKSYMNFMLNLYGGKK